MNLAVISLIIFLVTIVVGIVTKVNCGLVAMISAFVLVIFFMKDLTLTDIYVSGWPVKVFFMMMSVLLLFGIAGANGTMEIVAKRLIMLLHGRTKIIPLFIFLITFILAAAGAGPGIAPMIMPIAMGICLQTGVSAFMMGIIIECGAAAGGMSPIATSGIIARGFAEGIGVTSYMAMYIPYVILMVIEAAAVYLFRGGYKAKRVDMSHMRQEIPKMNRYQKLTLAVILAVITGVIIFGQDISILAIAGAALLMIFGVIKDRDAVSTVNWNTLLLVASMFMLITLVQKCGGMQLISDALTRLITPRTGTGVMALLSGLLATVTSSSGVVMPTLIPLCGDIAANVGGSVTAEQLVSGVISGANSALFCPFSVLGSLTIALYPETVERDKIFIRHIQMTFLSILFISIMSFLGFQKLFL